MKFFSEFKNNYLISLIFLIPFSLVLGPFIAELNIFFIILFTLINYSKINFKNYISKEIIFLFFFYIFIVISSFFSEYVVHSLKSSVPYVRLILYSLCVYLILSKTEIKIPDFQKYLIVYTMIFLSIDGIFQYHFGFNIFLMSDNTSPKISSLFGDEKILGSFLVRLLPFLIFLLSDTKNKYLNIFVCFYIVSTAIILIGERSALLLLLVIIFFSFIYFFKYLDIKKLATSIVTLLFLTTFLIFNSPELKKRYIDLSISQIKKINFSVDKENKIKIVDEGDNSEKKTIKALGNTNIHFSNQYFAHYFSAYKMFLDKKIIGHGPNNYRKLCDKKQYFFDVIQNKEWDKNKKIDYELVPQGSCSTHPHNIYAQFLSELGLVGLVFLLYAQFYLLKELFHSFKIGSKYYFVILTLFISLWPLTTSGNFFNNWLSIIYYFPLGFYLTYKYRSKV